MIYLSVDSIEDGYATCEDDNRDKWEINIKKLPNGIKEGDVVLIKDDGKILIDDKEKKNKTKCSYFAAGKGFA